MNPNPEIRKGLRFIAYSNFVWVAAAATVGGIFLLLQINLLATDPLRWFKHLAVVSAICGVVWVAAWFYLYLADRK